MKIEAELLKKENGEYDVQRLKKAIKQSAEHVYCNQIRFMRNTLKMVSKGLLKKKINKNDFWEDGRTVSSNKSTLSRFGIQTLENNHLGKKRTEVDHLDPEGSEEKTTRAHRRSEETRPQCRKRRSTLCFSSSQPSASED